MGVLNMSLVEKIVGHFELLREDVVVLVDTNTRKDFLKECFYHAKKDLLPELWLVGMFAYGVVAFKETVKTLDFFGGQCYRLFDLLVRTEVKQSRKSSREEERMVRVLKEFPTAKLLTTERVIPEDAEAAGKADLLVIGSVSVTTETEDGVSIFLTDEPRPDLLEYFIGLKGIMVFLRGEEEKRLMPSEDMVRGLWFRNLMGREKGVNLMVVGSRVTLFGQSDIWKERGLNVFFCSPQENDMIRTFLQGGFDRLIQEARQRVEEGRVYRIIAPMQTGILKKPS